MTARRVVVVGGGIAGLSAAQALLAPQGPATETAADAAPQVEVTVLEAQDTLGGKIRTSPFDGLPAVDEGPDAFLARLPWATALAREVGLGDRLVSPQSASAAVWWDRLHPIPDGLVLGLPTDLGKLARTTLISWRGKLRAASELLRPRTSLDDDAIGGFVRARFGDEVHERLVDPLVGSIYGADTDRFSLAAVPQLDELARAERSVLLAARHRPPPSASAGPVFYAPAGGVGELVTAVAADIEARGGTIRTGTPATVIERDGTAWRIDGEHADAIVLACPAAQASRLLADVAPDAAGPLGHLDYADVVMVTVSVDAEHWPERLRGMSGYLVPKPVQGLVTAVSFGSQKWAHWARPDRVVLRISLGRDGLPVLHLGDDELVAAALRETGRHLGLELGPLAVRITRWQRAFPQYRPHHHLMVGRVTAALPAGLVVAGASHHGIGIPACVRSGRAAAAVLAAVQ